jgi:hypothetical protein
VLKVIPIIHLAEELLTMLNAQFSPRYFADVEVRALLDDFGTGAAVKIYLDAAVLSHAAHDSISTEAGLLLVAPLSRAIQWGQECRAPRYFRFCTAEDAECAEILIVTLPLVSCLLSLILNSRFFGSWFCALCSCRAVGRVGPQHAAAARRPDVYAC